MSITAARYARHSLRFSDGSYETAILRRAHVTIFTVDYEDFQSQLSGFSRICEDLDCAPVIFTQDV
jgi:hypothetical protein